MKVTKEVRNSNDYDDNGELKGQYIYITYKDEEKNKVLEITIQKTGMIMQFILTYQYS